MEKKDSVTPPATKRDSINPILLREAIRAAGLNPNTSPLTSRRSSAVNSTTRVGYPSKVGSNRRIISTENVRNLHNFRRVDEMPSVEYPSLLPGGVRRESLESRRGSIYDSKRDAFDVRTLDSRRESIDFRRHTVDFQSDPLKRKLESEMRMLDAKEQREHIRELARRGSVVPEDIVDATRRASMNPPALELIRRGSMRTDDSHVRRRETVDGGALKEIMEFLRGKGLDMCEDDIWSRLSAGTTSLSTLMSLIEPAETNPNDPHSFSRCDSVYVQKIIFHWNLDFKKVVISGDVSLDIRRKKEGATSVSLDTFDLDISNVTVNGNKVNYILYAKKGEFGTKMEVELPDSTTDLYVVRIEYETSPDATGLTWVPADDAEGRPYPFVFSKNVSIQCRSIIPLQDTASNKITYVARIRAPTNLKVLMSAAKERQFVMGSDGYSTHYFRQDFPMAPKYIAFAAGHLASSKIGQRTTVWAHPLTVEKIARELVGTEELLCIAETICGEYRWKCLDIVVLPPTDLSLNALQNPSLILLNPNILTGDKCITHHIAHEIVHSWVGNIVTHANIEHLWLSEGIANYVARKIIGKKFGPETRLFAASRGLKELKMAVDIFGPNHPLTCLVTDLSERSPQDAVLTIPYEKGHTLMYYLEHVVEDPHEMEQYIKEYLTTFRRRSITSFMFKDHFMEFFSKRHSIKNIDWNAWFNTPGMPPFIPDYHTYLEDSCSTLVEMWTRWKKGEKCPFSGNDLHVMNSLQILEILDQMLDVAPFPIFKLEAMNELYGFESNKNTLIVLKWYLLCLRGQWTSKVESALRFAKEDGRQLYLLAVYRALNENEDMHEEAIFHFLRAKGNMSPDTVRMVTAILHLDTADEGALRRKSIATRLEDRGAQNPRRRPSVAQSVAQQAEDASPSAMALNIRRRSVLHSRGSSLGSLPGVHGSASGKVGGVGASRTPTLTSLHTLPADPPPPTSPASPSSPPRASHAPPTSKRPITRG